MGLQTFTTNSKTILSVDFHRDPTCLQRCNYCYVDNMERIYPAYEDKIWRNAEQITNTEGQKQFAQQLNTEYRKARRSDAKAYKRLEKLPVRIYGSGDYMRDHFEWIKRLQFKFFLISKNLTRPDHYDDILKLFGLDNLTTLVLSFDNQNLMQNYAHLKGLIGSDRIQFSFTGETDHFAQWKDMGYHFDIFFNILSKRHKEQAKAAKHSKQACPAEAGFLDNKRACSHCHRCWFSSKTKGKDWNKIQS